jgi:hypothetical protein
VAIPGPGRAYFSLKSRLKFEENEKVFTISVFFCFFFLVNIADGPFYVGRKVVRFQRSRPIHIDVVISRLLEPF